MFSCYGTMELLTNTSVKHAEGRMYLLECLVAFPGEQSVNSPSVLIPLPYLGMQIASRVTPVMQQWHYRMNGFECKKVNPSLYFGVLTVDC
jgi:hypothetical protein